MAPKDGPPGPDARDLLRWYDRNRRRLPWRAEPGEGADPYRVWLSEIMLQQTTVAAVIPYFEAFTARWPTVEALAAAPRDDVLKAWAGLGYYARARNLHACAQMVAAEHGGRFPDTEDALRALPGVGDYTAAAVAAIAFARRAVVVDGNVVRVIARLFAVETPMPKARREIAALTDGLTPADRAGDFAQAMMDLGATVCTPTSPDCLLCPWRGACRAHAAAEAASYPKKAPKKDKPTRYGVCFWAEDGRGAVLLRTRPDKGLLGGMTELPGTPWRDAPWADAEALTHAPAAADWRAAAVDVRHTFTHFHLVLRVMRAETGRLNPPDGAWWADAAAIGSEALPTVMKKAVRAARDGSKPDG
jgi:A/G-specific adenine glycosylase